MTQNALYHPVQIQKNKIQNTIVKPYSINKYSENPFLQTKTEVESLTDQKKKLLSWLKSQTLSDKRFIFTFTSKSFSLLIRAMYERNKKYSQSTFRIVQQEETRLLMIYGKEHTYRSRNNSEVEAQQQLINNLLVISKDELYDSLGFSDKILNNIDKLFQLFQIIEDGISNQVSLEQYKFLQKESNQIFFYKKQQTQHYKKSLGKWLVEVFKKHVWCQYYRNLQENQQFKRIKQKKKYNKIWKQLSPQRKMEMLKLQSHKQTIQFLIRQKSSLRIKAQVLPKVNNPKQSEIIQFLRSISQNSDIQIYDFLTQCTLQQSSKQITSVRWVLYSKLKKEIFQCKQAKNMKKKKLKNKKKKQQHFQSQKQTATQNKNDQSQEEAIEKIQKIPQKITQNVKQLLNQKMQQNSIKQIVKKDQKSIKKQMNKKNKKAKKYMEIQKNQQKKQENQKKSKSKSITSNQTNQTNIFNNEEQQITQQEFQIRRKFIQHIYNQKLKSDIIELSDSISQIANSYIPYRIVAFNRIQYLLNLYGVSIKIFGSCATGLALANSDIDLAVDPSILNYFYSMFVSNRDKVILGLNSIVNLIENRSWVSNIKLITTASIPILKFEINPNIAFQQNPKDSFLNILKEKQKTKKVTIKVDLTIQYFHNSGTQQSNHLGIMATNSMNQWMSIYPSLHVTSLIMKYLLKKKQLSNIYKGGISSYSIILMIIAYINYKNLTQQKNVSKIFYGFLDFFTQEFKHNKFGIDIRKQNPSFPFYEIDNGIVDKILIKDPLNGKVITANSYEYPKIIAQFKNLRERSKKIENQLDKYLVNPNIKLPQKAKFFTKNYLQQYFNDF